MTNRQVEYLPIDELKPDPRNPKAHALETIEDSMRRFGFVEPIVLDARTGLIVSGHGRHETLTALRARGEGPPDGVRVDESGRWLAPVATGWASGSDLDAAGALIALNRTGELGGWVDDALLDLLAELAETDSNEGVGYTADDIVLLQSQLDRLPEDGITRDLKNRGDTGLVDTDGMEFDHTCPSCGFEWSE